MSGKAIAFLSIVALGLSGCGGSMVPVQPHPGVNHAGSKFFYVVNSIEASVRGFSIQPDTGVLAPVGPAVPADEAPLYAAATPDGKFLYVANAGTNALGVSGYRINPSTGVITPTSPAEFQVTGDSQPVGIVADVASTHIYTANVQTVSAFAIDPASGNLSDIPGTPVSVPTTAQLVAIALTPDNRFLYATDIINNRVWEFEITPSSLPRLLDSSASTGRYPAGIAVDPSGRFVYVTDWMSNDISVFAVNSGTGILTSSGPPIPAEPECGPQEVAVDPSSRILFVSCAGISRIGRFAIDSTSGELTALNSFSTGQFTAPRGIAIDASGSYLYSAWNTQNKAGSAAVGANGSLTAVPATPASGRGPIGVALSGHQ